MKFYCDQCSAKYSIPDEKVRGKVVKVRCKECDHVITVRGNQRKRTGTDGRGSGRVSTGQSSSQPHQAVQWYYSEQGETFGPFSESDLRGKYRDGEIPPASYVWREGFSDWKPAEDVDQFSKAIERARDTQQPRRATQGVGGDALEAVEPVDDRQGTDESSTTSANTDSGGGNKKAPKARTGSGAEETTRSTDKGTGRAERLERLRNRLQSSFAEDTSPDAESDAGLAADDETVETSRSNFDDIDVDVSVDDSSKSSSRSSTTNEGLGPERGFSPEQDQTGPQEAESEAEPTVEADEEDFDLPPAGSDRLGGKADTGGGGDARARSPESDQSPDVEEHDGLFDEIDRQDAARADSESAADAAAADRDTDIPTTPKLGDDDDDTEKSFRDSVSESLLIQIDNIKKTDRSEYVKWGGVAVALLAAIGGAWWYLYNPESAEKLFGGAETEESRTAIAGQGKLEFQTYSEDEVLNFGATKVPKNLEEVEAEPGSGTSGSAPAAESGGSQTSDDGTLTGAADSLFAEDQEGLEQALAKSNAQNVSAGGESGASGSGSQSNKNNNQPVAAQAEASGSESSSEEDPFAGLGAIDSPTAESMGGPNIERPEDTLGKKEEASSLSSQLSKERISRAIRNVGKSVGTCRQRHARHGAPLDARKVTIVFTVQRDGRVSAFQLNPKGVRNTRFEKCLQARKGRWNFGPIPNAPQQMKAPFILQ